MRDHLEHLTGKGQQPPAGQAGARGALQRNGALPYPLLEACGGVAPRTAGPCHEIVAHLQDAAGRCSWLAPRPDRIVCSRT